MDGRLPIYAVVTAVVAWALWRGFKTGRVQTPRGSYSKAEQRIFYWCWTVLYVAIVVGGLAWTVVLTWDAFA